MTSRRLTTTVAAVLLWAVNILAQSFDQMGEADGMMQSGGSRSRNFNPHSNDSTRNKEIPKGLRVWTVDEKTGDIAAAEPDTLPHLYPNSTLATGRHGEFSTIGSNYLPRLNRIFIDRPDKTTFLFSDAYDQILKRPGQWHFTNTLSPITNLSYDNCGDKTNGEDHIDARFAVNAGKRTGFGLNLNYAYARGYFQNQNNSHFGTTFHVSHLGDQYQMHALLSTHHQKAAENGGIVNDNYVTHPELFTETFSDNEIPTMLESNWNRNNSQQFFLTHRYCVGFYRKVRMSDEEIKAREFAQASARERKQNTDSLQNAQEPADTLDALMKREFVPVTSFIHTLHATNNEHIYQAYTTPTGFYQDTFYDRGANGYGSDSIYDKTTQKVMSNTLAIALLEGFNKYVPAGLKAFATHEIRSISMPSFGEDGAVGMRRWNEHNVSIGGQLLKTTGQTLHYDLKAETWLAGEDAGQMKLDAQADVNLRLLGDTVRLQARAYVHRTNPSFYMRHYHSKHLWWDNDLSKETRTRIEGTLSFDKTKTRLRVAIEEMQDYTYLGMSSTRADEQTTGLTTAVRQHSGNINVLTAQVEQRVSAGPLHWDNIATLQTSSSSDALPLPKLNIFTNLYLKFTIAHVLRVELGASATWFTKYDAPDFCPVLNQFAVQENPDTRIEVGNFPFIDAYANMHLKHARFFVMMQNAAGKALNRQSFLAPHYPVNRSVLHMGISWNIFN